MAPAFLMAFLTAFPIMTSEIVHDDDIAGPECRHQQLLDIGEEATAVDGAVEDAGRVDPVQPEGADEGEGCASGGKGILPSRRCPTGARPWLRVMLVFAQVSSMKTSLVGSHPALDACRQRSRRLATVGAILFAGVQRFF